MFPIKYIKRLFGACNWLAKSLNNRFSNNIILKKQMNRWVILEVKVDLKKGWAAQKNIVSACFALLGKCLSCNNEQITCKYIYSVWGKMICSFLDPALFGNPDPESKIGKPTLLKIPFSLKYLFYNIIKVYNFL